jgi:tol-pal system protein YbgF
MMTNEVVLSKSGSGNIGATGVNPKRLVAASLFSVAVIVGQGVYAAVPVEESFGNASAQPLSSAADKAPTLQGRRGELRTIEPTQRSNEFDEDLWGRSEPANLGQTGQPNFAASNLADGSLAQIFYQMQVLQQEVQMLRGQVEEHQYQIENLRKGQKEQYVDLDSRVAALAANRPAPTPGGSRQSKPTVSGTSSQSGEKSWTTEREAYAAAIELMRAKEFDSSISGFEGLIVNFPNGQYTPNAFYWLGELYLAQTEAEKARQNFVQVVRLYPDHQKVPGALYKLGVLYHGLGDDIQAKSYLDRVQAEHPKSSAAKLASKYAQAMN